jgi:hypothetical protein
VFGLIFELVEWTIKLTIILVVITARLVIYGIKALVIATAFVIASVATLIEQRRQKRAT